VWWISLGIRDPGSGIRDDRIRDLRFGIRNRKPVGGSPNRCTISSRSTALGSSTHGTAPRRRMRRPWCFCTRDSGQSASGGAFPRTSARDLAAAGSSTAAVAMASRTRGPRPERRCSCITKR
jgi:hypothetical protein